MAAIIVDVGGCENPDIGDQKRHELKKLTKENSNQLLTPKTFCWTMIIEVFLNNAAQIQCVVCKKHEGLFI